MSISVYRGSELNRLARQFVDRKNRELKPDGKKASFADWELVINDELPSPSLRVRYAIYKIRKQLYVNGVLQRSERLSVEFANVAL